eukprot:6205521-Pleurochrysis_carterae.AAC.2
MSSAQARRGSRARGRRRERGRHKSERTRPRKCVSKTRLFPFKCVSKNSRVLHVDFKGFRRGQNEAAVLCRVLWRSEPHLSIVTNRAQRRDAGACMGCTRPPQLKQVRAFRDESSVRAHALLPFYVLREPAQERRNTAASSVRAHASLRPNLSRNTRIA